MSISYSLYVKKPIELGWKDGSNGSVSGTTGLSLSTDAFRIHCPSHPSQFRIHIEGTGWLPFVQDPDHSTGHGARLEAIQFRGIVYNTDMRIWERAHVEGLGWCQPKLVRNGTVLGTTGRSLRLEAVQFLCAPTNGCDADELERAIQETFRRLARFPREITEEVVTHEAAALGIGGLILVAVVANVLTVQILEANRWVAEWTRDELQRIHNERERRRAERDFMREINRPGWMDLPGRNPEHLVA